MVAERKGAHAEENGPRKKLLYHLTTEPGTVFIPGDKSPQHIETINIFEDNTATYAFFKSSPFPDRINYKMNCELEKKDGKQRET